MQIIVDKLLEYPPHAICRRDIPVILSVVPPEWGVEIKIVRLSGASSFPIVASYNRFDHTLMIKSRGQTTENTLRHIYIALVAHGLGIEFRRGGKLQACDVSRVEHLITPLMDQVWPLLSRKKLPLARRPRG